AAHGRARAGRPQHLARLAYRAALSLQGAKAGADHCDAQEDGGGCGIAGRVSGARVGMSVMAEPVYLVGLGATTPVGRDALSTAAAVRAGISGFAEHPYLFDTAGEPIRAAIAPWLDID